MNWPISACRLASVSLLSATLLFTAASCEDASNLGVELPGTNLANTDYRDFPVSAATVLRDSLETQKADRFLTGRVRDNVLGTTAATAFLNFKLAPLTADTLPSAVVKLTGVDPNPQLDSLVLEAPFDIVYGSAATPFQADVFQLAQPLDERQVYNSASSVALGDALGRNVSARLNATTKQRQRTNSSSSTDTTTIVVTVQNKTVRLKLHGSGVTLPLANNVFTALKGATFRQSDLDAVWKGVAIQPTAGFNTAIVSLQASTSGSRAVFYYHYTNKKNTGTLKGRYSIPFGYGSFSTTINAPRFFTQITNELPSGSPLSRLAGATGAAQSVSSDETDGKVYMQGGNGFGARLTIPGLEELKTLAQPGNTGSPAIAINRAELLIPVSPSANLLFPQAPTAYLYEVNAANQPLQRTLLNTRVERIVLQDGISQTGAGLVSITNDPQYKLGYYQNAAKASLNPPLNTYYTMSITGYVQAYVYDKLSGVSPAAFVLSPALRNSNELDLNRAVLDGSNIKLRVYYSKLR